MNNDESRREHSTMRDGRRRGRAVPAAVVTLFAAMLATSAQAQVTAEQKCEGGKNDAAGKYAACVAKAEKSYITKGDATKYADALAKCESKYGSTWSKLEQKAVDAGTTCPSIGDATTIQDFLDSCAQSVAVAVAGGDPPVDPIACGVDLETCDGNLDTCMTDLSTTTSDLAVCEGDLTACESQPHARPVKTGQQTCTNAGGTVVSCAGTGQDGDVQAGAVRSYTNNGDGTITDHATGLMWEVLTNDGSVHDKDDLYTWAGSATKVATVNAANLGGHNDWRLPNRNELQTILSVDTAPAVPGVFNTACPATCSSAACSCTASAFYWTSTSDYPSAPSNAWRVSMTGGSVDSELKSTNQYVRLVRDTALPSFAPVLATGQTSDYGAGSDGNSQNGAARSFTDNGDGTITDNVTGLMWEKKSDDGSIHDKDNVYTWGMTSAPYTMNGTMVTTFLADLNSGGGFAGYTDWRIPNIYELQSLVNFEVPYPGPTVFSQFNDSCTGGCTVTTCSCTRSYDHWSSTTYQYTPGYAWLVYFYAGTTGADFKTDGYSVRAVRAGS